MLDTELGMVMELKDVQPENADSPMPNTELGMVMELKAVQPENANRPMLDTEFSITTPLILFP